MGAKQVKAKRHRLIQPPHFHPLPSAHTTSTITTQPINTHYHTDALFDGHVYKKEIQKAVRDKGSALLSCTASTFVRGIFEWFKPLPHSCFCNRSNLQCSKVHYVILLSKL